MRKPLMLWHNFYAEKTRHSHSIVSGTYNHLKIQDFLSGYATFTVTSTAKTFRLGAIVGDRY
jgi:hypothetical protein